MPRLLRITLSLSPLILFVVGGCTGDSGERGESADAPFTDVITLELSFGAENVPEDYMLVDPGFRALEVNPDGDILVADENWIKVFDSSGNPKALFGGEGDGPGEFRRARDLYMNPNGYFTVFGGLFGATANYFRPDFSYIERVNYMSHQPFRHILEAEELRADRPEAVFCLGEEERLYIIGGQDVDREKRDHRDVFLIHETTDSLYVVAHHAQTDGIIGGGMYMSALGKLLVAPLPGNRAVYLHTFHDSRWGPDEYAYTLTIIDLNTYERTLITHPFKPSDFTWVPFNPSEEYRQQNPEQWKRMQDMNVRAEKTIAERQFMVPVFRLETDDQYIFAFTSTSNDSNEVQVDVFDANAGQYVCSAYFPASLVRIRNGYLHMFNQFRAEDDYPRVEKYRIDPKVYGRR